MTFHREPLGLKQPRQKDAKHLARVAQLPCVICGAWPVQVHHCICGRFSQRKAGDYETIPLCYEHHLGADGIHSGKETWVSKYGADHEYLPVVADMLAGEFNSPWRH